MEIRTGKQIKNQQFINLRKRGRGSCGGRCRALFLLAWRTFSCGGCGCCCVSLQLLLPLLQEDSVLLCWQTGARGINIGLSREIFLQLLPSLCIFRLSLSTEPWDQAKTRLSNTHHLHLLSHPDALQLQEVLTWKGEGYGGRVAHH